MATYFGVGDTSSQRFVYGSFIGHTNWHHMVAIVNRTNNTIAIYNNGSFSSSTSIPAGFNINASGFNVYMGRRNLPQPYSFDGTIDQTRIYARVLSLSEIQSLYQETAPVGYTLAVQSTPITGISITGSNPGTTNYTAIVQPDDNVSLTAPANAFIGGLDYSFIRWTLDGVPQPDGQATLGFIMDDDHAATAQYEITPIPRQLNVQSTPITGIDITGTRPGITNYNAICDNGEIVTLTASATVEAFSEKYVFVRWTLDGAAQPAGQRTIQFIMNANRTAVASYEVPPPTRTLTVESTPVTGIGISGTRPNTTNYTAICDDGESVTLKAPAGANIGGTSYSFVRWVLDTVQQPAGQTTITFTMNADRTAVAEYEVSPIPAGFVASWRFENNVLDDTGTNNGTRFGGTFVPGKIGQALSLSRAGQNYIDFGNHSSLNFGTAQSLTISAWVRRNTGSWTQEEDIIAKHSNSWQGWRVGFAAWGGRPRLYFGVGNPSGGRFAYGGFVDDTQWHHVVAILDRSANNIRIWSNGALIATTSIPSGYDVNASGSSVNVGRRNSSLLRYLDGSVDQTRVYPRVLTPAEIQTLYGEAGP